MAMLHWTIALVVAFTAMSRTVTFGMRSLDPVQVCAQEPLARILGKGLTR